MSGPRDRADGAEPKRAEHPARPDTAGDTRKRIASKISIPDNYQAHGREDTHLDTKMASREQAPFGDRWNGHYEPSNGRHVRKDSRERPHQQHRANSQSSDYTSSSNGSGGSASSGQS